MDDTPVDIGEILMDAERVERACRRAIRQALRMHKLLGNPVATWRDGNVVWIAPEDIVVEEDRDE